MEEAYFLTVDWCSKGRRGIFCSAEGQCFRKDDEPHTDDEMWDILGPFYVVLSPQSVRYTIREIEELTFFMPLAEYSGRFGIALAGKNNTTRKETEKTCIRSNG